MAEDLVQETFIEAWGSMEKLREPDRARAWLFQILRHRFAHHQRTVSRRITMEPLGDTAGPASGDRDKTTALAAMAEQENLRLGLEALSVEQRTTFLMVFTEGLTCREASESLGIPLGTVLSRLDSARRALRVRLRQDEDVTDRKSLAFKAGGQ